MHAHIVLWLHEDDVEEAAGKIVSSMPAAWDAEKNEAHKRISGVVQRLTNASAPRWQAWLRYEEIYQDRYWEKTTVGNTKRSTYARGV